MIAPLQRVGANPVLVPEDVPFAKCTGVFNAGAVADARTGRVVLLFRAFEAETGRSSIGLAVSADGIHFDEVLDRPALSRVEPYEEWGVEDPRVAWLAAEGRYAITYTGHSPAGPRLCLATTDDILDPSRYRRHGPRLATENKNGVVFPETIGGRYAVLHRPMPRIVLAQVAALEDPWPAAGAVLLGTSHPRDVDLSRYKHPVTKIFATRDGLASVDKVEANRHLLPPSTRWVKIEGGNHSQFGWYGFQPGDRFATISRDAQHTQRTLPCSRSPTSALCSFR